MCVAPNGKLRLADAVVTRKGIMRGNALRPQAGAGDRRGGGRVQGLPAIGESFHASPSASYPFPGAICVATQSGIGVGPVTSLQAALRVFCFVCAKAVAIGTE
jgi:hypothetical protein